MLCTESLINLKIDCVESPLYIYVAGSPFPISEDSTLAETIFMRWQKRQGLGEVIMLELLG